MSVRGEKEFEVRKIDRNEQISDTRMHKARPTASAWGVGNRILQIRTRQNEGFIGVPREWPQMQVLMYTPYPVPYPGMTRSQNLKSAADIKALTPTSLPTLLSMIFPPTTTRLNPEEFSIQSREGASSH